MESQDDVLRWCQLLSTGLRSWPWPADSSPEEGAIPTPHSFPVPARFEFHDAVWFRAPLRAVMLAVSVFALLSLSPALADTDSPDHVRALVGMGVLAAFVLGGVIFTVLISDGGVEINSGRLSVRFESFFYAAIPIEDIVAVTRISPRPSWRYRWGLSTNWHDRISCSHGGQIVEIALARPYVARLWLRTIEVTRLWLAVREHERFILAIERSIIGPRQVTALVEPDVGRAA